MPESVAGCDAMGWRNASEVATTPNVRGKIRLVLYGKTARSSNFLYTFGKLSEPVISDSLFLSLIGNVRTGGLAIVAITLKVYPTKYIRHNTAWQQSQ